MKRSSEKSRFVEKLSTNFLKLNFLVSSQLSNQRIANDLLAADGMIELLIEAGFEIDGEEFVLRRGGLGVINKLKLYRDFYTKRLDFVNSSSSSSGTIPKPVTRPLPPKIEIVASQPFHERIRFPQMLKTSNDFLLSLEQLSDSVMQYEDKTLQKSALLLLPTEKFKLNALEKLRQLQKLIKSGEIVEEEPPLDYLILEELAAWFKVR